MCRRPPPPLWFVLVVAVSIRLLLIHSGVEMGAPGGGEHQPQIAFWFLFTSVVSWVWKAIDIAGKITLKVVAYSVHMLWWFARTISNFAREGLKGAVTGFRKTWDFLRHQLDDVLLNAWKKFWKFVDWARLHLEQLFKPVFDILKRIREEVLGFYTKWVRPILDTMDAARKVLRVLETFGIDWARKLDKKLGDLEARIDRPFRLLLAEINKVITVIDRIVTVDGLFQRLTLLRSVGRDIRLISAKFRAWRSVPLTDADYAARRAELGRRPLERVASDITVVLTSDGGHYAPFVSEHAAIWAKFFS